MATKKENPSKVIEFLEAVMKFRKEHPVSEILRGIFWLICIVILGMFIAAPERFFGAYEKYKAGEHKELMEKRQSNTPLIQSKCDALRYRTNADRVLLLELHNNTNNISGLPFFFAASSCESLADNVAPVAAEYAEVKLSLFPFATELFERDYWSGKMADMQELDRSLYYKMMSNNAVYCAFKVVQGVDDPVGILMLSYVNEDEIPEADVIKKELEKASTAIAVLLCGSK